MTLLDKLRMRLRRETFQPTALSALFSPVYIIRRGLFHGIRNFAPSVRGRVLDFGCGSKPYENLFTAAESYTGVDLEATGHDHADSKVDVFYDGTSLPFASRHFDAVVSFEVFEHVFNLPAILKEISRVTSDGGLLMISIPFAWHEHEQPYDFARYTSFGISNVLNAAGYEVINLKKTTTYLLASFQMLIGYLTQIAPRVRALRYLRQLCVIFPLTLIAYAINALLPKRFEYYCNSIVLARKCN